MTSYTLSPFLLTRIQTAARRKSIFNDRHKIIANNVIKSRELGKIKGTELTFENLACVHTVVSLRP